MKGQWHFLNSSYKVGTENTLEMNFKDDQKLEIKMFDSNYFLFSINQRACPSITFNAPLVNQEVTYYFDTIYHQLTNKEAVPCNTSKDYSFTACIRYNFFYIIL